MDAPAVISRVIWRETCCRTFAAWVRAARARVAGIFVRQDLTASAKLGLGLADRSRENA